LIGNRMNAKRIEDDSQQRGLSDKVVDICRVSKVVKGGRHLSFRALVVIGDGHGRVGAGIGKADAIPDAVRKATSFGEKSLVSVPLHGPSIPFVVKAKYGAALVLLKPAPEGTGIIAGTSMRAILDLVGIKDVVAKSLGSQNPINVVRATIEALRQLSTVRRIRNDESTRETSIP